MSANFYELLKYANTGIASPGMTYYDKMRALAMTGGGTIKTLTGIPPLSFTGNGKPLISLSMLGNTQQTGTPSPNNIIMPTFCGVRTGNLFDNDSNTINNDGVARPGVDVPAGTYSIDNGTDRTVYYRIGYSGTTTQINAGRKKENIVASDRLYVWRDNNVRQDGVMLNSGRAALPYEPFGWAEKITCAGQTVPVYLGEVPTVRRIMKLVLTGEETGWTEDSSGTNTLRVVLRLSDANENGASGYCSHTKFVTSGVSRDEELAGTLNGNLYLRIRKTIAPDITAFKQWLADEYANGAPVCVWYVLATEQTGIVNEPLCKIGNYADELHSTDAGVSIPTAKGENVLTVDTDLQPSSTTITGHIK